MKTDNNSKSVICKLRLQPDKMQKSVSTLLIPLGLLSALQGKIETHGSLSRYFSHLLHKYEHSAELYGGLHAKKVKRQYQEKGQKLRRKNFRPENADWLFLTETARGLNVSRCNLFVHLLKIDISKIEDSESSSADDSTFFPVGVPTGAKRRVEALRFISNYRCKVRGYLRELLVWRR